MISFRNSKSRLKRFRELTETVHTSALIEASLPVELWVEILALLRYMSMCFQTEHWTVSGTNYYGDHLLWMRLYDSVAKQIDGVAERAVGTAGEEAVDLGRSLDKIMAMKDLSGSRGAEKGLSLVNRLLMILEGADRLEMSIGTRDFLNGLASEMEISVYLLKQRIEGRRRA